jgi:1-deoxy-D-xylulose-5-phosphate reductoisomerase
MRDDIDIVICAISGNIALLPTMKAIEKGKIIGLANKEVLVSAGELMIKKAREHKAVLLPIDSEHNAIFQCLVGEKKEEIHRLLLTASGGPFFHLSKDQLQKISYKDALLHPTYSMGKKITIDSSTLMNKGLEVIEAHFLFDIPLDRIDVVIHPQSIVHSMVEFIDGSIKAQLSKPDMRVPIQYVLTYPNREKTSGHYFDFTQMHNLQFFPPDFDKFRCLQLAIEALRSKQSYPCYLNAANEILVGRFLNQEISWCDIAKKLDKLMSSHQAVNMLNLEMVFEVDKLARTEAKYI